METTGGREKKLGVAALVAIVLGSSIGSGIYDLPADMTQAASPGAAIVAWVISGIGMLMLCIATSRLYDKHPDVKGIYGFATKGFGKYCGFISGWSYYISALVANVAFATMLMACLGYFFPVLGDGSNLLSVIVASLCTWALYFIVSRGVESAAFLNTIVTICKMIPLFVFVVAAILCFNSGIFTADFWGTLSGNFSLIGEGNVLDQCQNSLVVILWVFIGVEAAAMMSDRAKSKSVANRATIIGVISLIAIYMLISLLPYGMMPREQIAELGSPVLAYLLESAVGPWGNVLVEIGMIVSIAGAWLSWTIIPAEVSQCMAEDGILPARFAQLNRKGAPQFGLLVMSAITQFFLITVLISEDAYLFCYTIAACGVLITWSLVMYYQLKSALVGKMKPFGSNLAIGVVGALYFTWAIVFGAGTMMLLELLTVAVGTVLYVISRMQEGCDKAHLFTRGEWVLLAVVCVGAVAAIGLLATGVIVI